MHYTTKKIAMYTDIDIYYIKKCLNHEPCYNQFNHKTLYAQPNTFTNSTCM